MINEKFVSIVCSLFLASHMLKCKVDDPKLNECAAKGANIAIAELVKGMPEYNLPSIDPLKAGSMNIDQSGAKMKIKQHFENLVIRGLSSAVITDFKVNTKDHKFEMKYRASQPVKLDGDYNITGKVMVLPISGHGKSHFVLKGFEGVLKGDYTPVEKNDELFWKTKNLDFDFNVTKVEIRLENLFNGDKAMGENMNLFLNENWKLMYEDLKPAFKTPMGKILLDYIRNFLERINLNFFVSFTKKDAEEIWSDSLRKFDCLLLQPSAHPLNHATKHDNSATREETRRTKT